jgi:hypothetical protein
MHIETAEAYVNKLTELGACSDAIDWSRSKTPQEAWDTCERADWMLWLIGRTITDSDLAG